MSISDADKPPVCSPVPAVEATVVPDSEADRELLPPDAGVRARRRWRPEMLLHTTFLTIAVVVVIASISLTIRNRDQVILPLVNAPLPGTCTFRKITGHPCPGCGLTRSFISMAHGRIVDAWHYNPAGFFFFAVVAFQIPYRLFQISRIRRGLSEHRFVRFDSWVLVALVVILIVQWLCGFIFGST